MKISNCLYLLVFLLSVFTSCDKGADVKALEAEVMGIHDEVMPKMGSLMKLKKQLKIRLAQADSTEQLISKDSLVVLINDLEEADEEMMQWMRNYKKPSDQIKPEEAINYLNQEKSKVLVVKEKINSSEKAAKAVLNNQ